MAAIPSWMKVVPVRDSGDRAVIVTVEPNEGEDRSASVTLNGSGVSSKSLPVTQSGKRERFYASDGEFLDKNGEVIYVLKS